MVIRLFYTFILYLKYIHMPNLTGRLPDDPRKIEKVRLVLSSELCSKGKSAMKDSNTENVPSSTEISDAEIYGSPNLPAVFSLDCPVPGQQNPYWDCAAFSTCYARGISWYYKTGAVSYSTTTNMFSHSFVYNQTNGGVCAGGSGATTSFDLMQIRGVCLEDTMQDDQTCGPLPNNTQLTEGLNYKIGTYTKVLGSDITAIKTVLYSKKGVVVGVAIDDIFTNATSYFIWNSTTMSTNDSRAGHIMCIVGWDDSKQAFKVIGSWGTGWNDSGFGWIGYDLFGGVNNKIGYYAYFMDELVSSTVPIANAGFDQNIPSGGTALLDGTGSSDPNGYIVSYLWAKVSGPSSPAISGSTSTVASIVPTVAGTYVYSLTVTDNNSNTAIDTVTIIVTALTTEAYTLSVTKSVAKGKTTDSITWNITLSEPPQAAVIEKTTGMNTSSYSSLYSIIPYSPTGTYSYLVSGKTTTRHYRLKIVKYDGTIVYSSVISIK
jgi:C1A family cysteine protease